MSAIADIDSNQHRALSDRVLLIANATVSWWQTLQSTGFRRWELDERPSIIAEFPPRGSGGTVSLSSASLKDMGAPHY
jgi:hypothetical protein